jgi:hypothetical protein
MEGCGVPIHDDAFADSLFESSGFGELGRDAGVEVDAVFESSVVVDINEEFQSTDWM